MADFDTADEVVIDTTEIGRLLHLKLSGKIPFKRKCNINLLYCKGSDILLPAAETSYDSQPEVGVAGRVKMRNALDDKQTVRWRGLTGSNSSPPPDDLNSLIRVLKDPDSQRHVIDRHGSKLTDKDCQFTMYSYRSPEDQLLLLLFESTLYPNHYIRWYSDSLKVDCEPAVGNVPSSLSYVWIKRPLSGTIALTDPVENLLRAAYQGGIHYYLLFEGKAAMINTHMEALKDGCFLVQPFTSQ